MHRPVVYILCFNLFRLIFFAVAGVLLFSVFDTIKSFDRYGVSTFRIFRFDSISGCDINQSSFVLKDGACDTFPDAVDNRTGSARFSEFVDVSGYALRGVSPSCAAALSRFEVQGLDEHAGRWFTVASCRSVSPSASLSPTL